jgi:negative regulator of replication initiation
MSTRAFTRLAGDTDVIRIPAKPRPVGRTGKPGNKKPSSDLSTVDAQEPRHQVANPFGGVDLLGEDLLGLVESDDEPSHSVGPDQRNERDTAKAVGKKKRKKKKTKKGQDSVPSGAERGEEDIDTIIRAVNEEYGEFPSSTDVADSVSHHKTVLIIDRRNLNAENELKRIFGSKTVNSVKKRQHHKQVYRASVLVHVKENWPKWENLGMSMEMTESKNNVQYFMFKHSLAYQQVQLSFMQAVASLDHNNIAAVLNLYPYHIDSLLQLSEVCRMTDDYQMGADLIGTSTYYVHVQVTFGTVRINLHAYI